MENLRKINLVSKWLLDGYAVKRVGSRRSTFSMNGEYINIEHNGKFTIKFQDLGEYVENIADDYYIIDDSGKIHCTNDAMEKYCNTAKNTFTFYKRYVMSNTIDKTPLFAVECTISNLMQNMFVYAENYSNTHPEENVAHYVVECHENKYPMWDHWNFAI